MRLLPLLCFLLLFNMATLHASTNSCQKIKLGLQILGSGGPELIDHRASSAYLVWQDGHARVLIDMGPGSMLRFGESGAQIEDLTAILLTHLHVDHAADLPALIKASYFGSRNQDLPVFGPTGNSLMPGTSDFIAALFNRKHGAFRYLGDYLTGEEAYRLIPHDIPAQGKSAYQAMNNSGFKLIAVPVHHGPIPALAWRIETSHHAVVISGDMNGDNHTLEKLAEGADLLVAHHAIPEGALGAARNLHMPPTVIGRIAATANVKQVVMSHRMNRTLGREQESTIIIRKYYSGPLSFAEDGQCIPLEK